MVRLIFILGLNLLFSISGYSQDSNLKYKKLKGFFIHIDPSDTKFLIASKKVKIKNVKEAIMKDSLYEIFYISDLKPAWNAQLWSKGIKVELSDTVSIVLENDPYIGYLSFGKIKIAYKSNQSRAYKGIANWFTIDSKVRIPINNVSSYSKVVSFKIIKPKKISRYYDSKTGEDKEIL